MSPHEQALPVLRRLLEAMIANPAGLRFVATALPQSVNWGVCVDRADYGRVAGQKGSHYASLRTVVAAIGSKCGERWWLTDMEEPPGDRHVPARFKPEPNPNFDASPIQAIIAEILELILDGEFESDVTSGPRTNERTVLIRTLSASDHALLTRLEVVDPSRPATNLCEAFGTLARAHGRPNGALMHFELVGK